MFLHLNHRVNVVDHNVITLNVDEVIRQMILDHEKDKKPSHTYILHVEPSTKNSNKTVSNEECMEYR